ncbi:MAG TPA: indole-3-glycerol phosphate synthase TrpC, partial [Feifaniaceae bacterium]|nr:indole-3-glycerol phosphate synthase TrpC [Feifaniaceae bacterium]
SKGVIAEDFPYLSITQEYEAAGAAAISVLTEPYFFLGSDAYLTEITQAVSIPVLRKDFTVDAYQIYEAKVIGAHAVLLICALLDGGMLRDYIETARWLGLTALVEAHSEQEVGQAIKAGARVIGVNNRDLRTFEVDVSLSLRLRALVPKDVLFVSESGISAPAQIELLRQANVNGVLVGETLMRSRDKKAALQALMGGGA